MRDSDMICQELWSVQKSKDCTSNFVENRCNRLQERSFRARGTWIALMNKVRKQNLIAEITQLFLDDSSFDSRNLWPLSRRFKPMGQAIQGFKALRSDITHYSQICQAGRGREKFRWHHVQYDRIWYKVYKYKWDYDIICHVLFITVKTSCLNWKNLILYIYTVYVLCCSSCIIHHFVFMKCRS